jgi:hypothetical protein
MAQVVGLLVMYQRVLIPVLIDGIRGIQIKELLGL